MSSKLDLEVVALMSRRASRLSHLRFSTDDARDFIQAAEDANVLPWDQAKIENILTTGRAFAVVSTERMHASAFAASLNPDDVGTEAMEYPSACPVELGDREVGGILTEPALRGARISYVAMQGSKTTDISFARGFVSLVVAQTLVDMMDLPGFKPADPLPLTYNTFDTAQISRAMGYNLGFRAPMECPSARQYRFRADYQKAYERISTKVGSTDFQLAYLQLPAARQIVIDALGMLTSPFLTVTSKQGQSHKMSVSSTLFGSEAIDSLVELLEALEAA